MVLADFVPVRGAGGGLAGARQTKVVRVGSFGGCYYLLLILLQKKTLKMSGFAHFEREQRKYTRFRAM